MPGYALDVAVSLRRCASGRAARHRGRTLRDDDGRFGMALGEAGVNAILVYTPSAVNDARGPGT